MYACAASFFGHTEPLLRRTTPAATMGWPFRCVIRMSRAGGIAVWRLTLVACADRATGPAGPATGGAARALNRRIEVILRERHGRRPVWSAMEARQGDSSFHPT